VNRHDWANQFLAGAGAPVTLYHALGVVTWQVGEGTKAKANPLATTQKAPGSWSYNSSSVQNYRSYASGLAATVTTVKYPAYASLLAIMRKPESTAADMCRAVKASPWGTFHGMTDQQVVDLVAQVRLGWGRYAWDVVPS
jgi:hypothetical protein